eukprot:1157880-Pelagomonas_calceolata.AAC.4
MQLWQSCVCSLDRPNAQGNWDGGGQGRRGAMQLGKCSISRKRGEEGAKGKVSCSSSSNFKYCCKYLHGGGSPSNLWPFQHHDGKRAGAALVDEKFGTQPLITKYGRSN